VTATLVLDTDSVLAYAAGHMKVGKAIADRSDLGESVIVPLICVMEAHRRVEGDGHNLIDLLVSLNNVETPPVGLDECVFIGGWARALGSLDLAHAVLETASRPVIPIMTGEPKAVQQILAPGWPIVELGAA
jgi:hypothetical protein